MGLAVTRGAVGRAQATRDAAVCGDRVFEVISRQALGEVEGEVVSRPAVVPDQRLDAAAVAHRLLEPVLVERGVPGVPVPGLVEMAGVVEPADVPGKVRRQAVADAFEIAAAGPPGPGAAAEPRQGGKGQDPLAQAVELELDRVPVEAGRDPEQPVRVVGEPVQVGQVRPLHVSGDLEPGGVLEAQHGVPPAPEVVGDRPASRGQPVPVRVEPPEQVAAPEFQRFLQLHLVLSSNRPCKAPFLPRVRSRGISVHRLPTRDPLGAPDG